MSSLLFLDLSKNKLEGSIPPELGSMAALHSFRLAYNELSGVLPNSLYNLSWIKKFQVGWNMLSGTIPADIGDRFSVIEILQWSCLDTLAGLELELVSNSNSSTKISNSNSSTKLTLTLEVFDERVRMALNIHFQSLSVGERREKSHFLVDPT
jgi:hypothetical protein